MALKYYICEDCGTIITKVKEGTGCSGEGPRELIPGTVDAAVEKHIPVISAEGDDISIHVGSVAHPMTPEHLIEWISIETDKGSQIKYLTPDDAPEAEFRLAGGERLIAAYAYCNLHGLWKAEA